MPRTSAGILLWRRTPQLHLLLGHLGGPLWARRDEGAWTVPKGEHGPDEDALSAARREFAEETGFAVPSGTVRPLGQVRQSGGKIVAVWAVEGDLDVDAVRSNTFELEWPPRSGRLQRFPELDRAAWLTPQDARRLLVRAQVAFVDRLLDVLPPSGDDTGGSALQSVTATDPEGAR